MPERSGERIGPHPTERVDRPMLYQSWNVATWLHWPYDPEVVQRLVPKGLQVDTFEGKAWVGMVPFLIENQRLPGMPAVPWLSRARETHLRTYVTAPDGRRGSLFFYLENERLATVLGGRAGFRLRYVWSTMTLRRSASLVEYRGKRLAPPFTDHDIRIEIGAPYTEGELGTLDHLLTAQWILYTAYGDRLAAVDVWHPPWPMRRARVRKLDERMFEGAGLPRPDGEPLVHFSEGVDAKVAFPKRVRG